MVNGGAQGLAQGTPLSGVGGAGGGCGSDGYALDEATRELQPHELKVIRNEFDPSPEKLSDHAAFAFSYMANAANGVRARFTGITYGEAKPAPNWEFRF